MTKSTHLQIRVSEEEKARYEQSARQDDRSMSNLVRYLLNQHIKKQARKG